MPSNWILLPGVLARGYRVASGPSRDYPYGALDRQRPLFKARGLDLDGYFNGTLSIDIRPCPTRLPGTLPKSDTTITCYETIAIEFGEVWGGVRSKSLHVPSMGSSTGMNCPCGSTRMRLK